VNPQTTGATPRRWRALDGLAPDRDRYGNKSASLSEASERGATIVSGWVLDTSFCDSSTLQDLEAAASELLSLQPETESWLLRSSSPQEDRAGASAAGLFRSEAARASTPDVTRALTVVVESAQGGALGAVLRHSTAAIAVLAQPLLRFDRWATLEVAANRQDVWAEGWQMDRGQSRWHAESILADLNFGRATAALLRTISAATEGKDGPWLMEVGTHEDCAWLLQIRPAPPRRRPRTDGTGPGETSAREDLVGWGLAVHRGDELRDWTWDAEHCPTPLAPLLAGLFGEWIASESQPTSSRLHRGYWYDPEHDVVATADYEVDALLTEIASEDSELESELHALESTACDAELSTATNLRAFFDAWLEFQTHYFARSLRGLRKWAQRQPRSPATLPTTASAERHRRWHALAQRIEDELPTLPRPAEALAQWIASPTNSSLFDALCDEWRRCAHLSAFPYDGRGQFWGENPIPLWREIQRRRRQPAPSSGSLVNDGPVCRILAAAEDDNEWLFRSYWCFRRVLSTLASALHLRAAEELLDLMPSDLFERLEHPDPDRLARARRQGRALAMQWIAHPPQSTAPQSERIQGRTACGGRCRARLWVGSCLADLSGEERPIAVVATVTPADAIYFDRIEGLVCEGGDTLGHASILAREHGVPCVVQVGRVSGRLGRFDHAFLDADTGELHPRMAPEAGSEVANS
jgi:phosphohistidine swiveling domain-containing protein